jgi:folate-binding protein YgfZ
MLRPSRALFRFSGPEAHKLLFDVVTARLVEEPGPPVWWALLSPQGKIQAEGSSVWEDGAFWMDVDRSVADAFLKRMRMYRLRAAVEIDDLREISSFGINGLGENVQVAVRTSDGDNADNSGADYDRTRIAVGRAELGPDFGPDTLFPHDIGMDLLGGVDFQKGCYIGQEVVSRMQHRGTARRRPVIVSGVTAEAGTPVLVGGREAGFVGKAVEGKAVGIVRLDRFDGGEVTVGGKVVDVTLPAWANYRLGESSAVDAT